MADPPADSIWRTVSLAWSTSMSATTTFAPSCANRTADTRPTPEPAPVTIALLPSSTPAIRSGLRHDGRLRRGEAVQPLGIAAEQLVLHLRGEVLHGVARDVDAVGPRRVRVRVVGLAHDVVFTEFIQALQSVAVLDDAAEDVVAEQLPDVERVEVGSIACVTHELRPAADPVPLFVQYLFCALQEVRRPPELTLRQGDLQVRVALEEPAEQPRQHRSGRARSTPRKIRHKWCVVAYLRQRRGRANVHARDQTEIVGRSHDGFPVAVGVVNGGKPQG